MAGLPPRPPSGFGGPFPPGFNQQEASSGNAHFSRPPYPPPGFPSISAPSVPPPGFENYARPGHVSQPGFFPSNTFNLQSQGFQNAPPAGFFHSNQIYNSPGHFPNNTFASTPPAFGHANSLQRTRGGGGRGEHSNFSERRKPPDDRPKHRYDLPGCAPWVLVKTKLGRRFVWNKDTNESFWKFPQEVMKAVIDFDMMEREKKERRQRGEPSEDEKDAMSAKPQEEVGTRPDSTGVVEEPEATGEEVVEDDSEYEEVEVTDDEEGDNQNPSKRQRTEEPPEDQPLEMTEDDIAWQLAAMEEGHDEEEEEEGFALTDEDCRALFRELLDDAKVNPYHTWDKVLENQSLFDDERYKALPNMRARKECFDDWARDRIHELKELRATQEKQDPKVPYLAFLQKHATPKLYWPEFRRKFKKEPEMRDVKLADKDREKLYRDHINRLKMPESTLKSDLSALLKALPISTLNRSTTVETLPQALLTDLRFISLPPPKRDALVEAYISTLPHAPEGAAETEEEQMEAAKRRADRDRREKALAERERRVHEEERRRQWDLEKSKRGLRENEEEIRRAMQVGKQGLRAHLEEDDS